jgi:hypothetical protein
MLWPNRLKAEEANANDALKCMIRAAIRQPAHYARFAGSRLTREKNDGSLSFVK